MYIIIAAAAVATLTMTISSSSISEKVRHYIDPYLPELLKELLNCPYCLSHWTSLPVATIKATSVMDFIITWLALVALSQIFIIPIQMVAHANSSKD
jgi:hypothetical protein